MRRRSPMITAALALTLALSLAGPVSAAGRDKSEAAEQALRNVSEAVADLPDQARAPSVRAPHQSSRGFRVAPNVVVNFVGEDSLKRSTEVGAIYGSVAADTDLVAQTLDDAVRQFVVLHSEASPEIHRFRVDSPESIDLVETAEGGVRVIARSTGEDLVYVLPPWARDANGEEVPTRYVVHGSTLTQIVDHRGRDVAYPIVADPAWSCGWTCTIWFTRDETLAISMGGGIDAGVCAFITGPAAPICAIAVATFIGVAGYAYTQGGCLRVVGVPGMGVVPYTHYGPPYCY